MKLTVGISNEILEEKILSHLDLKKCLDDIKSNEIDFYIIIDRNENDYIQCAGANNRFTIEMRTPKKDAFRHWRLGFKDQSKVWNEIDCHVGPISVLGHEVFEFETVYSILISYVGKQGSMAEPEEELRKVYNFRNITRAF